MRLCDGADTERELKLKDKLVEGRRESIGSGGRVGYTGLDVDRGTRF